MYNIANSSKYVARTYIYVRLVKTTPMKLILRGSLNFTVQVLLSVLLHQTLHPAPVLLGFGGRAHNYSCYSLRHNLDN